ncbi:MAG TPA: GNAT family N-acetyltransferase [Gammaproteobacteria bacterium]|nr:GNAT family N-acetyltransferase [Gammaproteobacteria bacterium]
MIHAPVTIRTAATTDLEAINRVVERAVMSWDLPERVKRLSLPVYRYTEADLAALETVVAVTAKDLVGVAAWEHADAADLPGSGDALLLHGLYVDPRHNGQGIGTQLLQATEAAAREQGMTGVVVKAQRDAAGFFKARGYRAMEVTNAGRDYAHRLWKAVD